MKSLSILIPTYNYVCASLVSGLQQQAATLGTDYEIIVADDGSTQADTIQANHAINQLPHCRYVCRPKNVGRAAIRNFLASEARHDWLVFIDSDMVVCCADFLRQYADCPGHWLVVCGGLSIGGTADRWRGNLRFRYEHAEAHKHTLSQRLRQPHLDFHTSNFMVRRDIMLAHPFDHRARYYGYEDVLFGKQLQLSAIDIHHIDNPMSFEVFETNADFLAKTEEGLRTLWQFRHEMRGYSRLLTAASRLPSGPIRLWHALFGPLERHQLQGRHPSLLLFKLYRLGYFVTLCFKK